LVDKGRRWVKLRDVCEVFDGPHATPKKTFAGPLFLGISSLSRGRLELSQSEHLSEHDFARWTRRVQPRAGDVVFSYETRLGEAAIIPDGLRCCLGRRMGLLRPEPSKVMPRFLLYSYLSPAFQEVLRKHTVQGSTVERILLSELPNFSIQIPLLAEQENIAQFLGALDDKIELNWRMNETLEALARAIFKSWFVDFEPVHAKMDGRWRRGQSLPGLPANLYDLFPDSFEDAALGKIPKGSSAKVLPDACEINPTRSLPAGSEAPYLDMANMPTRSARALGWINRRFTSGMKFICGDTLVARITPCLENGKTAFVDFLGEGQVGWGSTEYIVLRSKPPLPLEYSYFLARSDDFRAHAIANMTGTSGRQRVPPDCLKRFGVVIPPKPVAAEFGKLAHTTMLSIRAHEEESRTLAAIRDALLPKLISDEIRVTAAQELVAHEA